MEYQVVHVVIHTLIFLIGTPGNLLVLSVYCSKPVRTSTHILINALAVLDLLTCLFSTFHLLWVFLVVQTHISYEIYFFCVDILVCSTLFVTTAIAFDRFEAISRPHRRLLTTVRTRIFLCTTPLVVVMIMVPSYIISILPNHSDLECKLLGIVAYDISCAVGIICFVAIICLYVKMYMNIRKRGRVSVPKGPDDRHCPSKHAMQVAASKGHFQSGNLPLSVRQEYLKADLPEGSQIGHLRPSCTLDNPSNEEQPHIVIYVIPYQGSLESVVSRKSAPNKNPLHGGSLHTLKSQQHPRKVQPDQVSRSSSSDKQAATSTASQDGKEFGLPEPNPLRPQQSNKEDSCSSQEPSQSNRHNLIAANPRESISDRKVMTSVEAKTNHQLGSPLATALRSISESRKGGPQPNDTNKSATTSLKPGTTTAEPDRTHTKQHHQRAPRVKFKTTAMLIAATALFLITWIPFTSLVIRAQVVYCTQGTDDATDLFGLLSHIIFINSIANPFIYSLANANFRQSSARVLHKIKAACCRCTS